jgi:ABC-type Fe3+ transport system permease subunit
MASLSPILLAILIITVVILVLWRRRSRRRRFVYSPAPRDRVSSETRKQLVRLNGGNRAVAARLVAKVQERYPDRSEQWCWEKAIFDIERDRRV